MSHEYHLGGRQFHRAFWGVAYGAVGLCLLVTEHVWAASAQVEVLKEMPTKGMLREGEVIYVDDGKCPTGEIKKITGGNQKAGIARQVECVANPRGKGRS